MRAKERHKSDDGLVPLYGAGRVGPGSFALPRSGRYGHGAIFKITTGGTYSVVYDLCSQTGCFDGDDFGGAPIFGGDGNLYGVTTSGGQYLQAGVIYRLMP